MPIATEHQSQYSSNKTLLQTLSALDSPPYDWIVTINFYTALHLVEGKLAEENKHSENHYERRKNVRANFRKIFTEYQTLYNDSQTARYLCTKDMTSSKASEARSHLRTIENYIAEI